ncbi:CopG family transcriptional regulator [Candidatus Palauibacter sp.]|uniref:ribbon-helix-helix domain-containing protein n=1 Tax=Candidatus Palauibacter sp. TaxID=3101350 RepID=UPI003B521B72
MKTAISLPDELLAPADSLAKQMRVSRSELYATAVAEFVGSAGSKQGYGSS